MCNLNYFTSIIYFDINSALLTEHTCALYFLDANYRIFNNNNKIKYVNFHYCHGIEFKVYKL